MASMELARLARREEHSARRLVLSGLLPTPCHDDGFANGREIGREDIGARSPAIREQVRSKARIEADARKGGGSNVSRLDTSPSGAGKQQSGAGGVLLCQPHKLT